MSSNLEISEADVDAFLESYNANLPVGIKSLEFDAVRRSALMEWNDLQACPGSGKTTLVAAKLIILARKWKSKYSGICVLTHTNVACDEIRSRLETDSDGCKLLSYPHFIGTIQEFVNKFLALPAIRHNSEGVRFIDDETGKLDVLSSGENIISIYSSLFRKFGGRNSPYPVNDAIFDEICESLGSLFWLNTDYDLGFFGANNNLITFKCDPTKKTYPKLASLKCAMQNKGRFQYRDMYIFAHELVCNSGAIAETLGTRYPVVFIDEMQDTQRFQDDLINSVFECAEVKFQRFGDPDQAIFDNMGGEEANETFNNNTELHLLKHSHRFTNDIAAKAATLSLSHIGVIEAMATPEPSYQHAVFIFDDDTKSGVLGAYAMLIAESDPQRHWKTVKAVGATEGEGGHISAYWECFDRKKQVNKPRPEKLIDAVKREWWNTNCNSHFQYQLILQSILDLMRIGEQLDTREEPHKYFNKNGLKSWLLETEKYEVFRSIITNWIMNAAPQYEQWVRQIAKLKTLIELPETDEVNCYLAYGEVPLEADARGEPEASNVANVYTAENGRKIEVGTIHSVKGETHDATLILETKNHRNDLEIMLPYFTGDLPSAQIQNADLRSKPHHNANPPQNKQFLRQLYVAASRPRHLLCLAIHKDNISDPQKEALGRMGWKLDPIYEVVDE